MRSEIVYKYLIILTFFAFPFFSVKAEGVGERSCKNFFSRFSSLDALAKDPAALKRKIPLTREIAKKHISSIDDIKLFAHSIAFLLNTTYGKDTAYSILDFAFSQKLAGAHLHMNALKKTANNEDGFRKISEYALERNLIIKLEISETAKDVVDEALEVASIMNIKTIRLYPRKVGLVPDVIELAVKDLRYAVRKVKGLNENIDELLMEQHEDLKSDDLTRTVEKVNSKIFKLVFDFKNPIPANEHPREVLKKLAPHIRAVHINDIMLIPEKNGGFGFVGVATGKGVLPIKDLMSELLKLEKVPTFALEEQVGLVAPAFRFPGEVDPVIPYREGSETIIDMNNLESRLKIEKQDAVNQVDYIRSVLAELRAEAVERLTRP